MNLISFETIETMINQVAESYYKSGNGFPARLICDESIFFGVLAAIHGYKDNAQEIERLAKIYNTPEGWALRQSIPVYRTVFGELRLHPTNTMIGMIAQPCRDVLVKTEEGITKELGDYEGRNLNEVEAIIHEKAHDHFKRYMKKPEFLVLSEYPYIVLKQLVYIRQMQQKYPHDPVPIASPYEIETYYTGVGPLRVVHLFRPDKNIIEVG